MSIILFENNGVRIVEDCGALYLYDGSEGYRITSEWHNPDTYLWRGDKTALVVYHGFTEEEIRLVAKENRTISAITGRKYDAAELCRLLVFGLREGMGSVDIGYLENKIAASNPDENTPKKKNIDSCGYKLHGTLRERIVEMIRMVDVGSYVDIDDTRTFYRQVGAPLYPKGEAFIKRYGYLFCSMYPVFANEDDDIGFRFDIFEDCMDDDPLNVLREAGGENSEMLRLVKSAAGCEVTPVGQYGCGDYATVYVGENGKLYAIHKGNPRVEIYENIIDLMEVELKDHIPEAMMD